MSPISHKLHQARIPISCVLAVLLFAACGKPAHDITPEVDTSNIQGSSFKETPASPSTAGKVAEITTSPGVGMEVEDPNLTSRDIARIPSATPVPPTSSTVSEELPDMESELPPTPAPSASKPVYAASATSAPAVAPAIPLPGANGIIDLSFATLSNYKYIEPLPKDGGSASGGSPPANPKSQIPDAVMALSGKMVSVEGYMVPMEVNDDGGVKSFVLVKTQPLCCFGDTQALNEWIDVSLEPGKTAEFNVERPVRVTGTLEVGEKYEQGYVLSIYRLKATSTGH